MNDIKIPEDKASQAMLVVNGARGEDGRLSYLAGHARGTRSKQSAVSFECVFVSLGKGAQRRNSRMSKIANGRKHSRAGFCLLFFYLFSAKTMCDIIKTINMRLSQLKISMDKLQIPSFDEMPPFEIKHPDRVVTNQELESARDLLEAIMKLNALIGPLKKQIKEMEAEKNMFLNNAGQWTDAEREYIPKLVAEYERLENELLPLLKQLSVLIDSWKAAEKGGVN